MSYGSDIWCGRTLVPGRRATGVTNVALALYRRLITPRGTLRGGPEEEAYGFDVSAYIGAVGTVTAVAALPGLVRGECMKDRRVSDVRVKATTSQGTDGAVTIVLTLDVLLGEEDEPFALVLAASDVTVDIIGGLPEAA